MRGEKERERRKDTERHGDRERGRKLVVINDKEDKGDERQKMADCIKN